MKRYSLILILLSVVLGFTACQRDDSEPTFGERRISRLYVSTSDYGNATNRLPNVYIVDPADSSVFPVIDSIYKFVSGAKGGRFISYSPFNGGRVFQGSQNSRNDLDTAVQVMNVNRYGGLTIGGQLSTRKFNNVLGLDYAVLRDGDAVLDYLFLLNGNTQVADTMYIVSNVGRFVRPTKPRYHVKLDYNSWGIKVAGRDVLVSTYKNAEKPNSTNGIVVYKNMMGRLSSNPLDTLLTGLTELKFNIEEATNVRGLAYSVDRDLLIVTDYSGPANNYVGQILFFEKFLARNLTSGILKADRKITSTGKLIEPLDVAVDSRSIGKYIYVADAGAKRVFRYLIDGKGEVAPDQELNLQGRTPISLSLDAR